MTTVELATDSIAPTDAIRVYGGASVVLEDAGPVLPGGFLAFEFGRESRRAWSARLAHGPAWRVDAGADPLGALRLQDLAELDPGLTVSELRLSGAEAWSPRVRFRLDAGLARYGDGNGQLFGSGHLRITLFRRALELSIEPNAYLEAFTGSTTGLLARQGYAAFGTRLRASYGSGGSRISFSANPHTFHYPLAWGIGLEGSVSALLDFGPLALDLHVDLLAQEIESFVRLGAGLVVPLS